MSTLWLTSAKAPGRRQDAKTSGDGTCEESSSPHHDHLTPNPPESVLLTYADCLLRKREYHTLLFVSDKPTPDRTRNLSEQKEKWADDLTPIR